MKHHNYYVYILRCSDQSYYTGVTNNVERRLEQHQTGDDSTCYTFKRRPLTLVYYEYHQDVENAIVREKQIKGWSRLKKEALMNDDINELERLAQNSKKRERDD